MAETVKEVMTREPAKCAPTDTAVDAAKAMRDGDFGAVIVADGGTVKGILTDRDIVVRAVADGKDPSQTQVGDICTTDPNTLAPDDSIGDAVRNMTEADVRRLPVVEDGSVIGIVSLGDLAKAQDADSALADISAAPPNN